MSVKVLFQPSTTHSSLLYFSKDYENQELLRPKNVDSQILNFPRFQRILQSQLAVMDKDNITRV